MGARENNSVVTDDKSVHEFLSIAVFLPGRTRATLLVVAAVRCLVMVAVAATMVRSSVRRSVGWLVGWLVCEIFIVAIPSPCETARVLIGRTTANDGTLAGRPDEPSTPTQQARPLPPSFSLGTLLIVSSCPVVIPRSNVTISMNTDDRRCPRPGAGRRLPTPWITLG